MPEIPPLPDATILLVEVGSTAHGTGIPGDTDLARAAEDDRIPEGPDRDRKETWTIATHLRLWKERAHG